MVTWIVRSGLNSLSLKLGLSRSEGLAQSRTLANAITAAPSDRRAELLHEPARFVPTATRPVRRPTQCPRTLQFQSANLLRYDEGLE